jgi:lysyl-tRNA synthetase class II
LHSHNGFSTSLSANQAYSLLYIYIGCRLPCPASFVDGSMTAASTQPNGSETGPGSGSETSHNPLLKLTHAVKSVSLGRAHASSNGHATAREQLPEGQGRAAQKSAEKRKEKDAIAERIESEKAALEERYAAEDQRAAKEEPAEVRQKYAEGGLHPGEIVELGAVATMMAGQEVTFRARIETQRRVSAGLDFLLFREQVHTIQGVLTQTTPHMVKWVQRLPTESIVEVVGTLQKPKDPIRSASIHHLELAVDSIHLVSPAHDLPWDLYRPPESLRLRTQARILDLRHPSSQAIFRIRAKMVATFRRVLEDRGFLEINTPKFQPAATESGAEVFKVDYFGRTAFLAQSPQLPKQMCISADFGKVYEVSEASVASPPDKCYAESSC